MRHERSGFEELSLNLMHKMIQELQTAEEIESTLVYYLHSKGTYHDNEGNVMIRDGMMKVIVANWYYARTFRTDVQPSARVGEIASLSCNRLQLIRADSDLLHFHIRIIRKSPPMWRIVFFSCKQRGNFWWARAAHIRRLLSPARYVSRMPSVDDEACPDAAALGRQRFAYEHWIASSPLTRAVDCLVNNSYE
jgi:hypothetical protein